MNMIVEIAGTTVATIQIPPGGYVQIEDSVLHVFGKIQDPPHMQSLNPRFEVWQTIPLKGAGTVSLKKGKEEKFHMSYNHVQ